MKRHGEARPRLAVRGLVLHDNRLLLVNAWPGMQSPLWCAPGGGVEPGTSLPDNLAREIHEETGLRVSVGVPVLVNEFHDPNSDFHQVDVYFRCSVADPTLIDGWMDVDKVVNRRRFFSRTEVEELWIKPDSLASVAWGEADAITYDPLEPIVH